MKNLIYRLFSKYHLRHGLRTISNLENKLPTQASRFAVPFVYRGKGFFKSIEPRQNLGEIEQLYQQICEIRPERVLEIGTAKGGTLYLWSQAAVENAVIISVDLPGGDFGGAYPSCRVPFYRSFARGKQKIHLLRADSHKLNTFESVEKLLNRKPVDFAFIDGDHTYEGVKSDFFRYGPLVRKGGIIAFHDILSRADLPEIQVHRFWEEIKDNYETFEFIGTKDTGRKIIGIGMLRVGTASIG